jgi:hypothetical protein
MFLDIPERLFILPNPNLGEAFQGRCQFGERFLVIVFGGSLRSFGRLL